MEEAFKRMLGEKCIRDINNSIAQAIFESSGVEKHIHGLYKLTVKIDYIDPGCCYEHPEEKNYFIENFPDTGGVPYNILKHCIMLPEGLILQSIFSWDFAKIYEEPAWWRGICGCGPAIKPISASFEIWFTCEADIF